MFSSERGSHRPNKKSSKIKMDSVRLDDNFETSFTNGLESNPDRHEEFFKHDDR